MSNQFNALWPVVFKVVLPAVVTAAGTTAALLDNELFRQFCGVL